MHSPNEFIAFYIPSSSPCICLNIKILFNQGFTINGIKRASPFPNQDQFSQFGPDSQEMGVLRAAKLVNRLKYQFF